MNNPELATILEMINESEQFRPIVKKILDSIKSYGPELYDLMQSLNNTITDLKAEAIKRFMDNHGFTKKEAMLLVIDQWSTFTNLIQNTNPKMK